MVRQPAQRHPQELAPQVDSVSAGLSNKVFLDQDGVPTGVILTSRRETYVTAVGPAGIQFVSDQVWYDTRGLEAGALRETFLVGEVPLCEDAGKTMPGVRHYTMGNHRAVPPATYRDAWLCWTR